MSSESSALSQLLPETERLRRHIGVERPVDELSRELAFFAQELGAPVVGAMHITCADETEHECINAFQQGFVQYVVPEMKSAHQAAFRIANLGARYEWGAVRIAEHHFATPETIDRYKLLVVKVNSHVAAGWTGAPETFGRMIRYGAESASCGALHALLGDGDGPFVDELRELFGSEGRDRVALLRDATRVNPAARSLYAALVCARLQARQVVLDIQDHVPASPTLYVIVPCVTLNREKRDSEILSGLYVADQRTDDLRVEYVGLGDDPSRYELHRDQDRYHVTDAHRP